MLHTQEVTGSNPVPPTIFPTKLIFGKTAFYDRLSAERLSFDVISEKLKRGDPMKTIIVRECGSPDVMKLEIAPDPIAAEGEVVIKVHAIGVNPVDTYFRAGTAYKPKLPYTPGLDCAGVVESIGAGVKGFKPGDRVYTSGSISGAYAERALCKEAQAHPLPDKITFEQGACLGVPFSAAFRALFQRGDMEMGNTVVIHGASGGVGSAAVQFAVAKGALVIGTAGTDKGRKLVKDLGAHYVLDHTNEAHFDEVMEITGRHGADLIVEFLANVNLARDLKILRKEGRVVVVGSRGTIEIDPRDLMGKESAILGLTVFNATEDQIREIHAAITAGLNDGTLKPIVGTVLPLTEAPKAHRDIMEQKAFGKIILVP